MGEQFEWINHEILTQSVTFGEGKRKRQNLPSKDVGRLSRSLVRRTLGQRRFMFVGPKNEHNQQQKAYTKYKQSKDHFAESVTKWIRRVKL